MKWLLVCLFACSCQSALGASVEAYREARFPDAAAKLRAASCERMDETERIQFDLYSGLNHLALGNLPLAAQHLTQARAQLEARPELLSAEDQGRLFAAWKALGRLPGQSLRGGSASIATGSF
jgi:hypothetical protein